MIPRADPAAGLKTLFGWVRSGTADPGGLPDEIELAQPLDFLGGLAAFGGKRRRGTAAARLLPPAFEAVAYMGLRQFPGQSVVFRRRQNAGQYSLVR